MGQAKRKSLGVGQCIYCGSTGELSSEHVIPYGLGGNCVFLPKSATHNNRKKATYNNIKEATHNSRKKATANIESDSGCLIRMTQ